MFICFEGIDGAGKTTQARMLHQRLTNLGIPAERVADPGTTSIGTAIRQILLHNDAPITPEAQMLLFSAARAELAAYIKKQLAAGVTVICDRWLLSTYVYQGFLNGIPRDLIDTVFQHTVNLHPDVYYLMDLPADISLQRTGPGRDRYERVDIEQRMRMRRLYRDYASPDAVVVVDGTDPTELAHEYIFNNYKVQCSKKATVSSGC